MRWLNRAWALTAQSTGSVLMGAVSVSLDILKVHAPRKLHGHDYHGHNILPRSPAPLGQNLVCQSDGTVRGLLLRASQPQLWLRLRLLLRMRLLRMNHGVMMIINPFGFDVTPCQLCRCKTDFIGGRIPWCGVFDPCVVAAEDRYRVCLCGCKHRSSGSHHETPCYSTRSFCCRCGGHCSRANLFRLGTGN